MLYDEKMEALISAALMDGKLTDKERQVLLREAQQQGIDLDEFDMILDARLAEVNKAAKQEKIAQKRKRERWEKIHDWAFFVVAMIFLTVLCSVIPEWGWKWMWIIDVVTLPFKMFFWWLLALLA